jgi:hypothetical protein
MTSVSLVVASVKIFDSFALPYNINLQKLCLQYRRFLYFVGRAPFFKLCGPKLDFVSSNTLKLDRDYKHVKIGS